ncbi:MAG TPA: hydrogenase maturation nickel metallochaperone HypA [Solirubrobacterales bacterium]|nr:hydrogenase maturation nickel metallochaperone HypA [Solirubrobacterales bacterium]
MHELSISSAVVDTALRHAGGRRVTGVEVKVGALRQVVPDSLAFYFEIVSRGTDCEGAELELDVIAAWMRCATCGHAWDPSPQPVESGASTVARLGSASEAHGDPALALPAFRCPACERADVETVRGDELEVESIEVENAEEEQCIAPR